jgi:hypothetical protein
MALDLTGYEEILKNISDRYGRQKKEAEAGAIGEAIRRGLINPTGTSNAEFGLRQARVAPVADAEASAIAQILQEVAGRNWQSAENQKGREFQTAERLGSQQYGTSERLGSQQFTAAEAESMRKYQTGERLSTQDWQNLQNIQNQQFQTSERLGSQAYNTQEAEATRKYNTGERLSTQDWQNLQNIEDRKWKSAEGEKEFQRGIEGAKVEAGLQKQINKRPWYQDAGGALLGGLGTGLGIKWSDKRLKTNIKPLKTLNKIKIKEYVYKTNKDARKLNLERGKQVGVMAQELARVIPEAVSENQGYKQVDYGKVVPLLIKSVQELNTKLEGKFESRGA